MRLGHPIFHAPLAAVIELVKRDTPANYRSWPGGKDLPERLDCWVVQTGVQPQDLDFGLLATPQGFEDSPDAEKICSGLNSKGFDSVAIGRHANLLLWGFAGDPTQMTESARRAFINAVAYISRFDGDRPLAPSASLAREQLLLWFGFYSGAKVVPGHIKDLFAKELWALAAGDWSRLETIVRADLEYVRFDGATCVLDEDAKALGKSTRRLELLDAVAAALATNPGDPGARRLLARYLPEQKDVDASSLSGWIARHRERLFFSDVGGYRWFVDTRAPANAPSTQPTRR